MNVTCKLLAVHEAIDGVMHAYEELVGHGEACPTDAQQSNFIDTFLQFMSVYSALWLELSRNIMFKAAPGMLPQHYYSPGVS